MAVLEKENKMGALASCDFPLLKKWKDIVDSNKIIGFIDAVLCAFAQIIFSDNSFSGLVLLIASFLVSVQVGVAGLWSAIVSVAFCKIVGAPPVITRMGVHSFCSTLSGIIMGGLIFVDGIDLRFFVFFTLSSLFCTITVLACSHIFSTWNASALGLPFGFTTLVFMGAAQNMGFVSQAETVIAHSASTILPENISAWNSGEIIQSIYSGVSELLGGTEWIIAVLIGVALLMSSRIDFISAILGATIGALTAMFFGVPNVPILIGLYGYNGMLLMFVLNGRAFKITPKSYILNLILAGMTSILAAWMSVSFGLVGAVCTAFPFSIICCLMMIAAPNMNLEYRPAMYWGVPETVGKIKEKAEAKPAETNA